MLFVLVVAALGLGIGAVWELFEYSVDRLFPSPAIALRGLDDAMLDLAFDAGGTLLAGARWSGTRRELALRLTE